MSPTLATVDHAGAVVSADAVLTGDERAYVHAGDALAFVRGLPTASVDAVITDPPYASGASTAARRTSTSRKYVSSSSKRTFAEFDGDHRDQRSQTLWCVMWMTEALRVTKPGGLFLCFTDGDQMGLFSDAMQTAGWRRSGYAVWNKGRASRPIPNGFRRQSEMILAGRKGAPSSGDLASAVYLDGVLDVPIDRDKQHPSGKPVELMRALMALVPEGGVVLDPFAGSGTTGVAALATGRRFLGCESVEHYRAMAVERLVG